MRHQLVLIALLSAFLASPLYSEDQDIDLSQHWDDSLALENPHKGWYHHYFDNGLHKYLIEDDRELTDFPGMDHIYLRLAWSYLEPIEGQFNWQVVDTLIEKWTAKGLGIAFRISPKETSRMDLIEQQYATPLWVKKAGAEGDHYAYGERVGPDGAWEPIYDDPVYMQKLEAFIKAFADRYDGQPWLRYIDIGSLGDWGEGHTWGGSRMKYGFAPRKAHIDLYLKYFKQTPLVISDGFIHSVDDLETRQKLHQYVLDHGIAYRDDSPMVASGMDRYPETYSVRSPDFFEDSYRANPIVFELDHYPRVKSLGNWTGEPGSALARNHPGMTGPEYFLRSMELIRPSYIGYHGLAREFLEDNPEAVGLLLNHAGYWYFPQRATLPKSINTGENLQIHIDWINRGVAPAYNDYDILFRLEGPESVTVTLPSNNRNWMPEDVEATHPESYNWKLPKLSAGEYTLKLKVYAPGAAQTVQLGLTERITDADHFYKIAKLIIHDPEADIASLPPMGWNSWNAFRFEIDEKLIQEMADSLIDTGLAEVGYRYVCIDDGWYIDNARTVNTERFPSGIDGIANYMHARDLKLGLYTRWISIGHEAEDAQIWAEWGVDLIKNDAYKTKSFEDYWRKMHHALRATGRPIVHSVHFRDEGSNPSEIAEFADMWRITNDIQDYYNDASLPEKIKNWAFSTLAIIDRMAEVTHLIESGCWADPDMLEIGNGNQTVDEYRTQFTMWSLLPAPLIMGNDLRQMDDEILEILSNREVIAINQDPAVIPARRIRKGEVDDLWARQLSGGANCVVMLNHSEILIELTFTWEELGLSPNQAYQLRDLWAHKDLGTYTESYRIEVAPHGSAMLKLVPHPGH